MSYLEFTEGRPSDSGKTKQWQVDHVDGDNNLGYISWYAPWRRYCFYPNDDRLFDAACLMGIGLFITQRMAEYKKSGAIA
jgi:hypothetical protein